MSNPYQKILTLLQTRGVHYQEMPIDEADYKHTLKEYNLLLKQGAKSLVLKGDERFFLVVLAGDRRIDLKKQKRY